MVIHTENSSSLDLTWSYKVCQKIWPSCLLDAFLILNVTFQLQIGRKQQQKIPKNKTKRNNTQTQLLPYFPGQA